jgi:hypothetical protein
VVDNQNSVVFQSQHSLRSHQPSLSSSSSSSSPPSRRYSKAVVRQQHEYYDARKIDAWKQNRTSSDYSEQHHFDCLVAPRPRSRPQQQHWRPMSTYYDPRYSTRGYEFPVDNRNRNRGVSDPVVHTRSDHSCQHVPRREVTNTTTTSVDELAAALQDFAMLPKDTRESKFSSVSRSSRSDGKGVAPSQEVVMIAVGPGQRVPYRRVSELKQCIKDDFYEVTSCVWCQMDLAIIADAAFVYCPACKVMGTVERDEGSEERKIRTKGNGEKVTSSGYYGLSLGVPLETLMQIHRDILAANSETKSKSRSRNTGNHRSSHGEMNERPERSSIRSGNHYCEQPHRRSYHHYHHASR